MKSRVCTLLIAVLAIAALALPIRTQAQEKSKGHHHYKLIDLGTLGGANSSVVGESQATPQNFFFLPWNADDQFQRSGY